MNIYETILKRQCSIVVRIRADSEPEARRIMDRLVSEDPEYLDEELDSAANTEWTWGPFEQVYHPTDIEYPTASETDGELNVSYQPVTNV